VNGEKAAYCGCARTEKSFKNNDKGAGVFASVRICFSCFFRGYIDGVSNRRLDDSYRGIGTI